MPLKYKLKEIKEISFFELSKKIDWKIWEAISWVIKIWDLYNISYSNQRTHFYTKEELIDMRKNEEKQDLFTIEWSEWTLDEDENTNIWFQRRESTTRLKKIAWFLEKDNNFFPNNIIFSLNNEQWYNWIKEELYIDSDNSGYKKYFWEDNLYEEDNWMLGINFIDNPIKICKIENNVIKVPFFEIIEWQENEIEKLFEEWWEFEWLKEKEKEKEIKIKELQHYKLAWIVDWQHRIFSLRYLLDNQGILNKKILFTAFIDTTIKKQAEIFIDVNNNAKRVNPSLTYDLLPLTSDEKTIELATKVIFDKFIDDWNSPLKNILYRLTTEKGSWVLSQANFINELKVYLKKWWIFSDLFEEKNIWPIYWLIKSYFLKVNIIYSNVFDEDEIYKDKEYALYRTTWFGALLQFFIVLLIDYINDNKKFNINEVKEDSWYYWIDEHFKTSLKIIKEKLDFKKAKISQFRWKAWQKELANLMKYYIWITDDLLESDIEKIKEHLDNKSIDKEKLGKYNLNLKLVNAISNSDLSSKRVTFKDSLEQVIPIDDKIHFNKIIEKIIEWLNKKDFSIRSKWKTPYNTLSSILTRDLKDSIEKIWGYEFKRKK